MALPDAANWLAPGGTNRREATKAVIELYEIASLDTPGVEWFASPLAALQALPRLVSRAERARRRRSAERGPGCVCEDCAGSSVLAEIVPMAPDPRVETLFMRAARHVAGTVRLAVARHTRKDVHLVRHDGYEEPSRLWARIELADRSIGWLAQNQWIAWARLHNQQLHPPGLDAYATLAGSAGWWWLNDDVAVLSDRPLSLHVDERGRLHRPDGPVVVYEDGFSVNVVDGVLLPDWYFDPGAVTIDRIENEPNLEVRRLLVGRFGGDRYIAEAGGILIHEDEAGQLWSVMREILGWERTEMRMVRVVDATPQPYGTHKVYWLHVPDNLETARSAVAWTFSVSEAEYAPQIET